MTRAIIPALAGAADGKRYLRLGDFELYRSPTVPRWEIRMRDDDAARARQYPLGWHIEFGLLPVHALHRADLDVLTDEVVPLSVTQGPGHRGRK